VQVVDQRLIGGLDGLSWMLRVLEHAFGLIRPDHLGTIGSRLDTLKPSLDGLVLSLPWPIRRCTEL